MTISDPFIERLFLPTTVVRYQPITDRTDSLLPAERELVAHTAESRRLEFSSGRWCAREALRAMGLKDSALLIGSQRQPLWPPGIVGSISHSSQWSISVIDNADAVAGLGVDVEQLSATDELPSEILFTQDEQTWLSSRPVEEQALLQRVIFSAKESIYKALFPHYGGYIDYLDVELYLDVHKQAFSIAECIPALENLLRTFRCRGHFCYFDNHVWSGTILIEG